MTLATNTLRPALRAFLQEDLGATGDASRAAYVDRPITARIIAKQAGVLAGQTLPPVLMALLDPAVTYRPVVSDGDLVTPGTVVGHLSGSASVLLAGERTLLNLMQRMSGIATATHAAVDALNDPQIGILDTRKTAPGLRLFDKYAVQCGGGVNHRMGLYDAVMLKDNHWRLMTDLPTALCRLTHAVGPTKRIEVEVETPAELAVAIACRVEMILIDNQSPDTVRRWCAQIPSDLRRQMTIEASGGIVPATLPTYARTGVDYLSLGYLTNSVQALDLSLEFD
ncbi:nicotinate-nucleotide pyrophosphorylase [Levilactobacillus namurensis DSM 19117]|uniref:Probable nicotinate-nucleotide pyrophosphorylase [carboxylating] n=1 Tax=Levilactobacillus namurensis DSM 19117 TaxID=1423773 RepID=A0A0R1JXQ7_9LACO|nr:carboxylating nicotinate-nucleotide diphosphorylase [Levilactobacillus namurensis]KRK73153.1 nicotinate-nucleotide pyrophosphorylase [Levilactobacillus namurensis DSM 19117]GEO74737.1 putative nicotinate-nucleotide pyrophosphorylase [carboxylating] [Levilactobacillus namurensis]